MLIFIAVLVVFAVGYIAGVVHGVYCTRKNLFGRFLAAGNKLLSRKEQLNNMKPEDAAFYALKVTEKELEVTGEHMTPPPKTRAPK